jgi:sulfatase modifying factor 1
MSTRWLRRSGAVGLASLAVSACRGHEGAEPPSTGDDVSPSASALAPSCAPGGPGLTDCGPSKESCCTSLEVPGGAFYRTYDPLDPVDGGVQLSADGGPSAEADPATVSGFRLDKYQVTVGRFRQFVRAWNGGAGFVPAAGSGKHAHLNGGNGLVNVGGDAGVVYEPGWVADDDANIALVTANLACLQPYATWTDSPGSRENMPMECPNWFEAYAFCIWDGGFLPSEAEFEYAAAGGSEQREYPWGSTLPGTATQYASYDCYYPDGSGTCTGVANLAPVGFAAKGAGRWGQLDLAGNVWQWTLDRYAAYVNPCTDCANLTAQSSRAMRGADFGYASPYMLPPSRNSFTPALRGYIGFRCARAP